ncbi:GNAT domain and Acyl-CoA N-acyltransferase domain-containing protein [Strongyloides ratti]|uniref:aralkylamine N-acetyltransferase n=1 Tax=Strongyloides ratti TaxID=34506 RepID=A0A090LS13_STRRB|nr:GNAT domain and Acyl-CoA N-acyltransferase domain-containing protein [Strongyloides ratti]CEF70383.1 GNAT domain and Acyl-CoA N-acyltransferase domain-containing protein [Strongyloides ratti]
MCENGNITIRYANNNDKKDILEFLLSDFLINEALNASCGLSRGEAEEFFSQLIDIGLGGEESCIILNEKNEIIGCKLGCIMNRNDEVEEVNLMNQEILNNDGTRKIVTKSSYSNVEHIKAILSHVDSKLWDSIPKNINKIMSVIIISVSKENTRKGYGKQLITYGINKLKENNVQGIVAECSAIKSQNLFGKLGFTCQYLILHKEFVDENNHQIFIAKDETDSVKIMFKEI